MFTFNTRLENTIAVLSNWSVHTATGRKPWWMKGPLANMKIQCKSYSNCPFMGQMPELVKIDI
jgi:hypothetical protein